MKIEYAYAYVGLEELKPGDTFYENFRNEDIYIKTTETKVSDTGNELRLCVNLEDGSIQWFLINDDVVPAKIKGVEEA